jgi:phage gp46-like protein
MSNKHYSWLVDPSTGDYQLEKGSPIKDESLQFPAYVRLKTVRKSWLYAPDDDYGSDIALVRKQTRDSGQLIESVGLRALQPIIDDGRASDISISQSSNIRFQEEFDVDIVDLSGDTQSFTINPVGL